MDISRVEALLKEDRQQAVEFLCLRDQVRAQIFKRTKNLKRRQNDINKYEFNKIFSRFYMCCRNGRQTFKDFWTKMLFELMEKELSIPPEWSGKESISNLALPQERIDAIFDEISQVEDEHSGVDVVQYRYADLILQMPKAKHADLLARAEIFLNECRTRGNSEENSGGTEKDENITTAADVLKVTAASYMVASGSLYWGFGPKVYEFAKNQLNATLEAYASPFNHTLPSFCSPFELDRAYGSLGSFYNLKFTGEHMVIVANPPYIEAELLGCAEKIDELLKAGVALIVSIFPKWDGAEGLEKLRNHPNALFTDTLDSEKHRYYNYQTSRFINATFPSLGFALGRSSKDEEMTAKAHGLFAQLLDVGTAAKSRKRPRA
eukprot:GEMP01051420.1.p1 GENE.GEMP01051420.1~~GEMP01051420.1.p1  ORF type:complete len:378 (+),score=72.14 GEMP01051420.1:42-1175(+)